MWTLSVIHSKDVLFDDIYVNNLDESGHHSCKFVVCTCSNMEAFWLIDDDESEH